MSCHTNANTHSQFIDNSHSSAPQNPRSYPLKENNSNMKTAMVAAKIHDNAVKVV